VTSRRWLAVLIATTLFVAGGQTAFADGGKRARFATLEGMTPKAAEAKALAWLKETTKNDAAKLAQFNEIWKQEDRPVIDRLADTFALGSPQAAALLREARNPIAPAPTAVPALFRDAKQPEFFRANLALAYARSLSNRRVHEESLATLKLFSADQVADPASYLFHRAVSEHALVNKGEAVASLKRLLSEAVDSPERYKTVATLMLLDMQSWKEKDLGAVARKMSNIERRLELARGGPQTQKLQKEVISRLDELIKELENKAKNQQSSGSQPNGGSCPNGGEQQGNGPPNSSNNPPKSPAKDSFLGKNSGNGKVTPRRVRELAERWKGLPPSERAEAQAEFEELVQSLSLAHQEAYRAYFDRLREQAAGKGN
jgi:hypothetical protein